MRKFLLSAALLLLTTTIYSQIGGRYTYQFLNLVSSPRQAALGGKNVTGYDYDPTSALFNPASINAEMENQLSVNYVNYIADVNYGTVGYAKAFGEKKRIFQAGVTYINYGKFDGFDEFGNSTGDFTGQEVAVSIGHAMLIPNSKIYAGANAKFITSQLEEYTSLGGALDIGFMYYNPDNELNIGLVARNIGTQFTTYAEIREDLPFEVSLGFAQTLKNVPIRWNLTFENLQVWDLAFSNSARDITDLNGDVQEDDPGFFNNVLRHTILGAEFFPKGGFSVRLGYNFRRSEELRVVDQRSFAGLSGGLAIRLGKFNFSYTYARYNSAASSSFFGLNISLQ